MKLIYKHTKEERTPEQREFLKRFEKMRAKSALDYLESKGIDTEQFKDL